MFSVFVRSFWMLVTVFLVLNCKRRKTAALALFRLHWRIVNDYQYILCSSAIPCVMAFFPLQCISKQKCNRKQNSMCTSCSKSNSYASIQNRKYVDGWTEQWFACGMPLPVRSIVLFDAPNTHFFERILSIAIMDPVCTGFYHLQMHDDIKIQSDGYWYFFTVQSILIIWLLKYGMTTHVNLLIYFLTKA